MDTFRQDLRYGMRMMTKSPGFTFIAIIALALGIGANTAIFSVVNALLLRPLPFKDLDRIVKVWETVPSQGVDRNEAALPNFLDWRAQTNSFEHLGGYAFWSVNVAGIDPPERVQGFLVSTNFFQVFGEQAALGRTFLPEEQEVGKDKVVILSHGFWQRRFGADPNVVGKTLVLNNITRTVVGVMPKAFNFPTGGEMWAPYPLDPQQPPDRRSHFFLVVGRLKDNVTPEQAASELNGIASQLEQQYPVSNTGWRVRILPLLADTVSFYRPALLVLFCAVGFVLLIACANVANLLLARASARQKEITIRIALGAGRFRIIRQLLTESIMLSLVGGIFGVFLALWGVDLLTTLFPQQFVRFVPGWDQIGIDWRVLGWTALLAVATGVVFGLAPALQASRPDLNETLKDAGGKGAGGGAGRNRLRSLLVVAEFALSLLLLIGAGLMTRSFVRLMDVNPGFNPNNVLTMSLTIPFAKYRENAQSADFYRQLVERVEAVPGVRSAAVVNHVPLGGSNSTTLFLVEGQPLPAQSREPEASYRSITPNYFRTLEIPVLRGRTFNEEDNASAPRVAIINETLARRYFPNEDAVGKRVRNVGPPEQNPWMTVVGVAADVRRNLDKTVDAEIFFPHAQDFSRSMVLVARTEGEPLALAQIVRDTVRSIDKDQAVFQVQTLEEVRAQAVFLQRLSVLLLGIFSVVALVMAAVGIYGVMSYAVTQRTHEIGIRMALGAQPADVLRMVVKQGMLLTLIGIAVGACLGLLLTRVMKRLLFGVSATDPLTFIGVSVVLAVVALFACLIPARRAMRVEPTTALRYE